MVRLFPVHERDAPFGEADCPLVVTKPDAFCSPGGIVMTVPKYSAVYASVTIEATPVDAGCELVLTHEEVLPGWAKATQQNWGRHPWPAGRLVATSVVEVAAFAWSPEAGVLFSGTFPSPRR